MPRRHPSRRAIKRDLEALWPGQRQSQAELELTAGIEPKHMSTTPDLTCDSCGKPITCADVMALEPITASPGHGTYCNECVLMWASEVNEQ